MRYRPLAWLVVLGLAGLGQTLTGAAQTSGVDPAVMQAVEQVNEAFQRRDVRAYERLTTSDFVRIGSNGRVYGRGEWLKVVAAPGPERALGKFDQLSVRMYGDGAVVTYRANPVQPGVANYQTRVMGKQGGQWILALTQSTDLKAPAPPTGPEPAALPAWSASTPAEREALAVFQAIQKANADRDVAAWERLSAPDHSIIGADGTRTSRAERVAVLKAPPAAGAAPVSPAQNIRVIVKGDVAAVTSSAGNTRSLKILARQGGQWRQVLQQSSPIVMTKK